MNIDGIHTVLEFKYLVYGSNFYISLKKMVLFYLFRKYIRS